MLKALLASDEITVIRSVHYHQYDTYFFFDDPAQGRLRYREDEFLDASDNVVSGRARLTLTGPSREAAFGSVLLSRSRFLRARHPLTALLPRVLQARRASATSTRIAGAGWSRSAACSSTCTSTGSLKPHVGDSSSR